MSQPNRSTKKVSRLSVILQGGSDKNGAVADWGLIDGKTLIDLVQVIAAKGGAVRLGYTRDGGAYSVGIYLDDDRETFYCRPSDDLDAFVNDLTEKLRDL